MVDEKPTGEGSNDAGAGKHQAGVPEVAAKSVAGNKIGDKSHSDPGDTAGSDPLQHPERDEH